VLSQTFKLSVTVKLRGCAIAAVLNALRGCTGLGAELETTVDQALIRGLGTAFRVFVSGLSSV
jgi:hypothetical protein